MRIPDLQFSPISALSWVHIKYINMVTSRYLFHTHRMFIGDYPGPLWSHGATHKTGSHTPNAGWPHALRRGPCGTPALAASRLAVSRAFTIAHVMDFLISSLLDGRHPAARFAPVGKKVTRLAVGPAAYMHGPGHGPRTCPGSARLFAHWVAVTCMDALGRRPRRRRRARISCAAGEIAALRRGQAPPSGTGARAPVNGRRARS